MQGPRPLHWVPEVVDPHLDLDSVAIWLMSSEVVNGSTVMVYNQQMAIHACVHHSTILDIRARGFQVRCLYHLSSTYCDRSLTNSRSVIWLTFAGWEYMWCSLGDRGWGFVSMTQKCDLYCSSTFRNSFFNFGSLVLAATRF